jgi:hypothetical protein
MLRQFLDQPLLGIDPGMTLPSSHDSSGLVLTG